MLRGTFATVVTLVASVCLTVDFVLILGLGQRDWKRAELWILAD